MLNGKSGHIWQLTTGHLIATHISIVSSWSVQGGLLEEVGGIRDSPGLTHVSSLESGVRPLPRVRCEEP